MQEKSKLASGLQDMYDKLREQDQKADADLKAAQARYEAISVGKFSSEDGKAETLQGQKIKSEADVSEAKTTVKAHSMKIKHNEKRLKELESEMSKAGSNLKEVRKVTL